MTQFTERFEDAEEAARQEADGRQSEIWTSLPGIVDEHDVKTNTVKVRSAIKMQHIKPDGSLEWIELPQFVDVPIQYPGGGGITTTFPMKKGDEVLLNFSSRSIDKWWKDGGVQEQPELRMHKLADGFAIPGFRSQPRKLSNVSQKTYQLRTDDGKTFLDFDPEKKQFRVVSPDMPVRIEGDLHVTGEVIAKKDGSSVTLSGHLHDGVMSGGDDTTKPLGGT